MLKRHRQRGSTILESLFCIMVLCLIFLGLMQIFHWSVAQMLCEYSAFYATKAHSLGYVRSVVNRASRVAIMGASGKDESAYPTTENDRGTLSDFAWEYMSYGPYGPRAINFEYWPPEYGSISSDKPQVLVNYNASDGVATADVRIRDLPLLSEHISYFIETESVNPRGEARAFDHGSLFLESN